MEPQYYIIIVSKLSNRVQRFTSISGIVSSWVSLGERLGLRRLTRSLPETSGERVSRREMWFPTPDRKLAMLDESQETLLVPDSIEDLGDLSGDKDTCCRSLEGGEDCCCCCFSREGSWRRVKAIST